MGVTPQTSCNLLATLLSVVVARIGVGGLNLLTFRAVEPDLVKGIIAPASSCLAILPVSYTHLTLPTRLMV